MSTITREEFEACLEADGFTAVQAKAVTDCLEAPLGSGLATFVPRLIEAGFSPDAAGIYAATIKRIRREQKRSNQHAPVD